jgi:hypothetical protein
MISIDSLTFRLKEYLGVRIYALNCFAKIAIPNSSSCCLSKKKVVLSMFHNVDCRAHAKPIYLMVTFV